MANALLMHVVSGMDDFGKRIYGVFLGGFNFLGKSFLGCFYFLMNELSCMLPFSL